MSPQPLAEAVRPQIFIVDGFIVESYPSIADVPYATVPEQRGKTSKPIDTSTPPALQNRCRVCLGHRKGDVLLYCDDCHRAYHQSCVIPPLRDTPKADWLCRRCHAERTHMCQRTAAAVIALRNVLADIRDRPTLPLKMQLKLLDIARPAVTFGRANADTPLATPPDYSIDDGADAAIVIKPEPCTDRRRATRARRNASNRAASSPPSSRDASSAADSSESSALDDKITKLKTEAMLPPPRAQPVVTTTHHRSLPPKFRLKAVKAHQAAAMPAASDADKVEPQPVQNIETDADAEADTGSDAGPAAAAAAAPLSRSPVVLKRVMRSGSTKRRRHLSGLAADLQPLAARMPHGAETAGALQAARMQLDGGRARGAVARMREQQYQAQYQAQAHAQAHAQSYQYQFQPPYQYQYPYASYQAASAAGSFAPYGFPAAAAAPHARAPLQSRPAAHVPPLPSHAAAKPGMLAPTASPFASYAARGRAHAAASRSAPAQRGARGRKRARGVAAAQPAAQRREDGRPRKRTCSDQQTRLIGAGPATGPAAVNLRD